MSDSKNLVNKLLEGADVRNTIFEAYNKTHSDFENWWDTVKDDFMKGEEEFFDPYEDVVITWGVKFPDDGSVILYGDIDGVSIKLNDFKEMLKDAGVYAGTDVKVVKDPMTGGFKVSFLNITPEEFLEKVW